MMKLKFRPHHFLCTLGFEGEGYSSEFVAGFAKIARRLRETAGGDQTEIEVIDETDSICSPCPNKVGSLCKTQEKIESLDRAHARILNLMAGETLTWHEAKSRIKAEMSISRFHEACEPCSWKSLGVCETALRKLRNEK